MGNELGKDCPYKGLPLHLGSRKSSIVKRSTRLHVKPFFGKKSVLAYLARRYNRYNLNLASHRLVSRPFARDENALSLKPSFGFFSRFLLF